MGFYFLFWKYGPNQLSNLCTLPYSLKPCLNIYWRITLVLKKHEFKCCFENRFKFWKEIKLCFDSLSTAVMEGGAALGYMVAICHGYSHQTDQPCPALNIQYFHFLCHLFWRILSHSNWRIHTHWGLWFDLIHLSIEGMSELRVFNQLGPGYSTLDWIFKKRSTCHLSPVKSPRECKGLWITRCLELTQQWTLV